MNSQRRILLPALALLLWSCATSAQSVNSTRRAIPTDAVGAIVAASKTYSIVALGEGQHWNEPGHAFRLALLRDRRFPLAVNDIVVEFGNSLYQGVMDRFVAGEDVPPDSLRKAWENTTQPNEVWDMPIYAEFFRAVRDVNASLPAHQRLRVLLADPPIDWGRVAGKDDILRFMAVRDSFAATVIEREVLARKRRALLIFGDGHLLRRADEPTLMSLLEGRFPKASFVITTPTSSDLTTLEATVSTWHPPVVARLRGTTLGRATVAAFYQLSDMQGPPWDKLTMEQEVDALLYLGPPASITLSRLSPTQCADSAYMRMRVQRLSLVPWGQGEIDRLRRSCQVPSTAH